MKNTSTLFESLEDSDVEFEDLEDDLSFEVHDYKAEDDTDFDVRVTRISSDWDTLDLK